MEDGISALDYLEKIFQIPFWLPPMEEDASRNMIAEMVPRPLEKAHSRGDRSQVQEPNELHGEPPTTEPESQAAVPALTTDTSRPEVLAIEPEERNFMLSLAGGGGQIAKETEAFREHVSHSEGIARWAPT